MDNLSSEEKNKSLIAFFNQHIELTQEEIRFLNEQVRLVDVKHGGFLLKEGEISTAFYYNVKGLFRMFYIVDGIEKTTFFYEKNDFISSYESFTKQIPSGHFIQAIKDSTIAIFDTEVVAEILLKFPRFDMLSRLVMEKELSVYQNMVAAFVTLNAEQRYQMLLNSKPHLLQEVPQYHIATYLGVSPETLSRIKRRIRNNRH